MKKVFVATLFAATAMTGVAAFADTATKTEAEKVKIEKAETETRTQGGFLSRVFGFDARQDDSKAWTKERIRDRFEQPDRVGR